MAYDAIDWTLIDKIRRSPAALRSCFDSEDLSRHHGSRLVCPSCEDAAVTMFTASKGRDTDGYNDGCEMAKCQHCGIAGDIVKWYAVKHKTGRNTAAQMILEDFAGCDNWDDVEPARCSTARKREPADFTAYVQSCKQALVPDSLGWWYLRQMRGLTDEQVKFVRDRFNVGYDRQAKGHHAVVMPYDYADGQPVGYWSARYIEDVTINGQPMRYINPDRGIKGVFHGSRLYDGLDVVFVTESELEALMIELSVRHLKRQPSIGAVALGGADNHAPLVDLMRNRLTSSRLILAFDNDGGGRRADVLAGRLADVGQACEVWRAEYTIGRCQDGHGQAFNDLGDVFKVHGSRVTAGIIRAVVEYPNIFTTDGLMRSGG